MTTISSNTVISALFLYAPQFYTTDPDRLAYYNGLYDLIKCQVNFQFLSCCGPSVFAFLLAHYLTIAANPNLGIISNIAEGDLSLGYNVASDMNALEMTPYGRSYLDLVKRTTIGSTVSNLPVVLGGIIQNMPVTAGCGCGFGWGGGGGCGCGGC
jgi:hypothetical protein